MDAGRPAATAERPVCNPAETDTEERDEKGQQKDSDVRPYVAEEISGGAHRRAAGAYATRAAHPGPHDRPRPLSAGGVPSRVVSTGAAIEQKDWRLSRLRSQRVVLNPLSFSRWLKTSCWQPRPYHKTAFYTMACKPLPSASFPFKMGWWEIFGERSIRLAVTNPQVAKVNGTTQAGPDLERAIRAYVRTYAVWHGRDRAARDFGVSRHTLWRFLARGHLGRAIPRAVMDKVGHSVKEVEAAKETLIAEAHLWAATERRLADNGAAKRSAAGSIRLSGGLEDTLLLLCAAPLATVDELSRFGRVPASTLRERLGKLAKRDLVDSVSHQLSVLGFRPQRRYFPTEKGIARVGIVDS